MVVLGLMCGSELNLAAFSHPTLNRQSPEARIQVRSSFASLFGRVMSLGRLPLGADRRFDHFFRAEVH